MCGQWIRRTMRRAEARSQRTYAAPGERRLLRPTGGVAVARDDEDPLASPYAPASATRGLGTFASPNQYRSPVECACLLLLVFFFQ